MKLPIFSLSAAVLGIAAPSAMAALPEWQAQVATGTPAATTWIAEDGEPPAGSRGPIQIELGDVPAECTFEFLVYAADGSRSGALLGLGGLQAIKYGQWDNTDSLGITDYGVADHTSDVIPPFHRFAHVVFASDGVDTIAYLDGEPVYTFAEVPLTLFGTVALGAAVTADLTTYFDVLDGHVYGFAAYGSVLTPAEISSHSAAWKENLSDPVPASLAGWQAAVQEGTTPASTYFEPVSGLAPVIVNVGDLTDERSFEFLVYAGTGGGSTAVLGRGGVQGQGLKFEQWQDTLTLGITDFGVADHDSFVPTPEFRLSQVAWVFDGTSTSVYVDGQPAGTLDDIPLKLTGEAGLGASATIPELFFDRLDGTVLRFASYDSALTEAEIQARHDAFEQDNGSGAFTAWLAATSAGTSPAATHLEPVSGTDPTVVDVGALEDDRTFEFIVNANDGNTTALLMGSRVGGTGDGMKFEQGNDTGLMGLTQFGVLDHSSDFAPPLNEDVHIAYVSDGLDTNLYVNGELVYTFFDVALTNAGEQGLAAGVQDVGNPTFGDNLDGFIYGFASYNTALAPAEVAAHYAAIGSSPVPATPDFRILSIARNATTGEVTLTWNSTAGRSYGIVQSTELATRTVVVPSVPATGTETAHTFAPAATESTRVFFQVVENQPTP